jgi:hypothetical protein
MNWIRYSGVWLTLILNPFHWRLQWFKRNEFWHDTKEYTSQFLFLSIRVVVDDGSW